MSLNFTPGRTIVIPDEIIDTDTGIIYRAFPCTDTDDPRDHGLTDTHTQLYVHQADSGMAIDTVDDIETTGRVADATRFFANRYDNDGNAELALDRTRSKYPDLDMRLAELNGYAQSDWARAFVVTDGAGDRDLDDVVTMYRQWLYGDVWEVTCDIPAIESEAGIYADSAEEAVEIYRDNNDLTAGRPLWSTQYHHRVDLVNLVWEKFRASGNTSMQFNRSRICATLMKKQPVLDQMASDIVDEILHDIEDGK